MLRGKDDYIVALARAAGVEEHGHLVLSLGGGGLVRADPLDGGEVQFR